MHKLLLNNDCFNGYKDLKDKNNLSFNDDIQNLTDSKE